MIDTDYSSAVLHNNDGYPTVFTVTEFDYEMFHGEAEADYDTERFLQENSPETLKAYRESIESIPVIDSRSIDTINLWVSNHTYNSIEPFYLGEGGWLEVDEDAE